jgi:hypothetical protein
MSGGWTALVLAAGRPDDPLALAEGVANKNLIDVHGRSVLQRVLDALDAAPSIGRVVVAIEDASLLQDLTPKPGAAMAGQRVVDTVGAGLQQLGPPLLIVTGDHALLTPDMVEIFIAGAIKGEAGVAAGLAAEEIIQSAYPDVRRTYLRFADGGFSGCNLFALLTSNATEALAFWQNVDRNRKRPWALIRSVDPWALALYTTGRLSLDRAMERLTKKIGVKAIAVRMPVAEAAIDVDKPDDLALVRTIIGGRGLP